VVAQCSVPGVSIAAVALQNALNANLLRRWVNEAGVRDEEQAGLAQVAASETAKEGALEVAGFVPVKLATSEAVKGTIVIEVRRGAVQVKVSWPLAAMTECGAWLRELMK
jgi:transposase